jgi:tubulin polyglutamylase TTLL6/13
LIEEMKFDLRVYVLVTSCDPLRVFLYREGLARFATEKYCAPTPANLAHTYMHLTNYSLNKNSENFVVDENNDGKRGSKRSISSVMELLEKQGCDVEQIWKEIGVGSRVKRKN